MTRKLPTIRRKLALVVLACLLPSCVGMGLLIFQVYERERAQLERDALQTARALTAAVDRDLSIGENVALALASSPTLASQDLAAFYAQAKAMLREEFPGFTFVLTDATGQQRLNTLRPFGSPLPRHGNPEQVQRLFETGRPVLSDVYIGGVLRRPLIGIDVPVWRGDKIAYDLSVAFLPEALGRVLTEQRLPPGRIVTVLDTKGVIVARTRLAEQLVGRMVPPNLIERMQTAPEGAADITTLEGIPAVAVFSRSPRTNWTVAIAIPKALILPEILCSLAPIAVAVLTLLGIGFGTALTLGGRIGRSVSALTTPALALGAGKPVVIPHLGFREAVEVAETLKSVESELNRHRYNLEALVAERTAALGRSTARLEQILEAAGEGIFGIDTESRLTFINRAATESLGWRSSSHLLGTGLTESIGHRLADGTPCTPDHCSIRQTLQDGQIRRVQGEFFRRADGVMIPVEYVVAPYALDDRLAGTVVVFGDVTERMRSERRLAEAHRELKAQGEDLALNRDFVRAILDSVASHIVILEADGTIAEENDAWKTFAQANGLAPTWTAVGVNYLAVCQATDGADRHLALAAADGIRDVIHGRRHEFILEYPCHNTGRKRWSQMRVMPLKERQGRVVINHDDISSLKLAEAALRESENRLALATRGAGIGIWDWDLATNTLLWNDEIFTMVGLTRDDRRITTADVRAIILNDDYPQFARNIIAALTNAKHFDTELRISRPDGEIRYLKLNGRVFNEDKNEPNRMVGICYDITSNKQTDLRLNELLDLNQKIVTECPVGIVAYKASGDCVLVNDAYARILGGTSDEVRAGNFLTLPCWTETGLSDVALMALKSGTLRHTSVHHVTPFGREVWAEAFFVPFTSGGEPHLLCIKSDVSEQVKSNEQLAAARDRAEAASRAKTEFVANMSHEIRTPMNAIMGLSRLLQDSELGEQERDYVAKIKLSAQSLLGILNDILDFSKIEADRLEIEHAPFALDEVLRNIAAVVATNARDKGIETIFQVAPDVPKALVGDALRLQQVLLNLTGNAVKFTKQGEVVLAIRKDSWDQDGVTLEFSVKDTGIGIPDDKQAGLFAAFTQADSSTSRRYGGTGLGLTISARLVTLMGGAISVTSRRDQGSVFRFTARFGVPPQPEMDERAPFGAPPFPLPLTGRLTGLRVLLVEDNQLNQQIAETILTRTGAHVVIADNGQRAIDCLEQQSDQFDVVLMDVQMPEMDGYEATRIIRTRLRLTDFPIIAMTANAMEDDRRKSAEAGMTAHLAKPIDVDAMISTLAAYGSDAPTKTASPGPSAEAPLSHGHPPLPQLPGLDLATVLTRLGGNQPMLASLLHGFVTSQGPSIATIRDLLDQGDHKAATDLLHRLRGVAANLGAIDVAREAGIAEHAIKTGNTQAQPASLAALERAMAVVVEADETLVRSTPVAPNTSIAPADILSLRSGLAELLDHVRDNDLKAIDDFLALRSALEATIGLDAIETLSASINALEFGAAITYVTNIMNELSNMGGPWTWATQPQKGES